MTAAAAAAELRLDHRSSKWNRSTATLRDSVGESAAWANVITLTEVADGKRPAALARDGWTVVQDRQPWTEGECAVLVEDSDWEVERRRTYRIGPDLGPGNEVTAVFALLRHRATGRTLLVTASHLPSAVEGRWNSARAARYRRCVLNWRKAVRRWNRMYRPDAVVMVADWNLDLKRPWVRAWQAATFPRLRPPRSRPAAGTHGRRLIDWPIAARVSGLEMRVLPAHASSDHRAIRVSGTIRPR